MSVTTIETLLADARRALTRLTPDDAAEAARRGAVIVDIRPVAQRLIEGEVPGVLVVERNVLEWRFDPVSSARLPIADHDLQVVVLCSEGYTSSLAAAALQSLGVHRATDVVGGFRAWRDAGLPVTGPDDHQLRNPSTSPTPSTEDPVTTTTDTRAQGLIAIFEATDRAVAADAAVAGVVFRAEGSGEDGVLTRIRAGRHSLVVDEPSALGGGDTAANPVEHALAAIVSCQVVAYCFWAARLGVTLDDVEVQAEGDLDVRGFLGLADGVRPGFGDVRLAVTLRGPESPERYAELQRAVDAHCPVLDLFSNPTPVSTTLIAETTDAHA